MNLNDYAEECHKANMKWWADPLTSKPIERNFGELIALAHSELSEALEGHRKGLMDDKIPHRRMVEVELVDCLIRIFDLAAASGMDLQGAFEDKMAYNAIREDHTHKARMSEGGEEILGSFNALKLPTSQASSFARVSPYQDREAWVSSSLSVSVG